MYADIDLSKINPLLKVNFNEVLNCWEITHIKSNITFIIDQDDIDIFLSGRLFYPKIIKGFTYITCDNYFGKRIYLQQIIVGNKVDEYEMIYRNKPIIFFRNRNSLDFRKSNLDVVSRRVLSLNFDAPYVGVTKDKMLYRIKVLNPRSNTYITERFKSAIEAAMAYDYYINLFYPDETYYTNYGLRRYSPEIIEVYKIHSIRDIKHPFYTPMNYLTSFNNTGYYGIYETENGKIISRYTDPVTGRNLNIEPPIEKTKLIEAVARREYFLIANPEVRGKSNVKYPDPQEGKIIIAGIIVKQNER